MSLLSVQDARQRILSHFEAVEAESLPLAACPGRVLAADIIASDLPPFDNSSVDGFAVLASDLVGASPSSPRSLPVVADIPAGTVSEVPLIAGQAARIMTGAPLPPGADAVIMIEDTDFQPGRAGEPAPANVRAFRAVSSGENIRRRGMDIKTGRKVLFAGQRLRPQDIGLLAMLGVAQVSVHRRPRLALLSSGDELIGVEAPLSPGKIRDSNSYTLSALAGGCGCEVLPLGVAPDDRASIGFLLDQAVGIQADVILTSAGVSVGALDFVKEVIESQGSLEFWRVNMRPGKPLAFGQYRGIPLAGLPGNPVSAFVGFEVFIRPALGRLAGLKSDVRPRVRARLAEKLESDGRESYLRAVIEERDGQLHAKLTGHQGSGNLLSLVQANALLIVPAGVKSLAIGDQLEAWML